MWDPAANEALNSGNYVMFQLESTFASAFPMLAPDTKGKWGVTKMRTGVTSLSHGMTLSILSQSKNKEAAWAFVEYAFATMEGQKTMYANGGVAFPGFKPMWDQPEVLEKVDEFLAPGFNLNKPTIELLNSENTFLSRPTPLDAKALEIWNAGIAEALENNTDSRAALRKIQEDIEAAVAEDRAQLLNAMGR